MPSPTALWSLKTGLVTQLLGADVAFGDCFIYFEAYIFTQRSLPISVGCRHVPHKNGPKSAPDAVKR